MTGGGWVRLKAAGIRACLTGRWILENRMEPKLEETVALLARTPGALNALLRGLPDTWTMGNEGAGTWNPAEVVAHLIHAEREDWIPHARVILEFGENRPFPQFDREGNFRAS